MHYRVVEGGMEMKNVFDGMTTAWQHVPGILCSLPKLISEHERRRRGSKRTALSPK